MELCAKNGAYLCVNERQKLSEYRVSLTEETIFDRVYFSRKMDVLEGYAMYTGSISHIENNSETRVNLYFVMYYIYGQSRPSLVSFPV